MLQYVEKETNPNLLKGYKSAVKNNQHLKPKEKETIETFILQQIGKIEDRK